MAFPALRVQVELRNEPALYGPDAPLSSRGRCDATGDVASQHVFRMSGHPLCADSGIDDGWGGCHRSHTKLVQGLAGSESLKSTLA